MSSCRRLPAGLLWAIEPYIKLDFISVDELKVAASTRHQIVVLFERTPSTAHPNFGLAMSHIR